MMRTEWSDYLRSLGFADPLMKRAETVVRFYTEIVQVNPSFLFVSEYRDQERRVFDSIWLCNEKLICEAKEFIQTDQFDCVPLRNNIVRWETVSTNFDWVSANDGARFTLDIVFENNISGNFQASGDNCLRLVELLKEYITPSLVKQTSMC